MRFYWIVAMLLTVVGCENGNKTVLETIAFGSCNHQYDPQLMWPEIGAMQPQLWVWLGDNIYADTDDMKIMAQKYKEQLGHEEYKKFIAQVPLIGIWDDHDYGANDAGKEYGKKDESKELMLEFLNVPNDAAVRNRKGAYQSYDFGKNGQKVRIILLDGRYFRDSLSKINGAYRTNETGTLLGEAQWEWLEEELSNSKAEVHLIGCGIQFVPEGHPYEKWANFPSERTRFFNLLAKYNPQNTVLISGDRHIGEISRIEWPGLIQPLYDITSSGLTHSWETNKGEPNKWRVGPLIKEKNFGILRIDWSATRPVITAELRGLKGKMHHSVILN